MSDSSYIQNLVRGALTDPRNKIVTKPETWTELDLSSMKIHYLTSIHGWQHYSKITVLHLQNNFLTAIPEELFHHLVNLTVLDLSSNHLTRLPTSIDRLSSLRKLSLQNNQLAQLPVQMGSLDHLKDLNLDNNPLKFPPPSIVQKGTKSCLKWLRDHIAAASSVTQRHFMPLFHSDEVPENRKFSLMSYNILGDSYATPDAFPYCPAYALAWKYRRPRIFRELESYNCDVICLQEVPMKHYDKYFLPGMEAMGYQGLFFPKSRSRTMAEPSTVDGCVIFYRSSKFKLVEHEMCEFQRIAMSKHKDLNQDLEAFNRVITRDNVAIIAVFQLENGDCTSKPEYLLVANTHIHWNTEHKDVKLMQVMILMEQISSMTSRYGDIPMVIAGDFNSTPTSGPYQFLQNSSIPPHHPDLHPYHYGSYSSHGMQHPFHLSSAYGLMGEPLFTNTSSRFVGTLDYLWFTDETLTVSKVLQPIEEEITKVKLMPNLETPSDHICIASEFCFR